MNAAGGPAPRQPAPDALDETYRSIRRVMMALRGCWHDSLVPHGLTFPQWLILKSLHRKGRMTVRELADTCEVTSANVTGILDRLERDGLAIRSRSSDDRRVVYVRLTEDGHAKVKEVIGKGSTVLADMFEGWTEEELARLREALGRIRLRPEEEEGTF